MPKLTIRLPEEKLDRLRSIAAKRNLSPHALVIQAIDEYLPGTSGPSLADALQDYIGAIDGPPTDSSQVQKVFGDLLEEKQRRGEL